MEVPLKTRIFASSNIDWKMKKKDSNNRLEEIIDGVLQITPDIEEEIAEVEQGQVVTMDEFKTMFAKWLD